jgi:nitrite reductase (NO-forming)
MRKVCVGLALAVAVAVTVGGLTSVGRASRPQTGEKLTVGVHRSAHRARGHVAGARATALVPGSRHALEDGVRYETAAPLRVWSFGVNGRFMRGNGASPPIVVNQGDRVEVTFVNGANAAMDVDMGHSLDIHAAEVDPTRAFKTIPAGARWRYRFTARTPGVYMYHCATEPMVWHLGAGMAGMFLVKPRRLPKVDRELWLVQQEYYLPAQPGADPDYAKMAAEHPDVMAFNGYANQYVEHPIRVTRGERIRIYLLNPGPSHVSSFHIIGGVFDITRSEGVTGGPAQVLSLAPAAGGSVDFTLKHTGDYAFVDHNFASMQKGAMGVITARPPRPG